MELAFTRVATEEDVELLARLASEIWNEYFISIISKEQIDYMLGKFQSVQAVMKTIAVYEKKGFRTVRTQVADIGNGFVMDDHVMEKEIVM
ncbi:MULTISPECIES: hypothetical protein [unclassified Paenibacillus]|uniref:hypothetical protein n=1 Tax=unclassified Paenibacillus TaxID=185978 RepID=UPI001C126B8D|nr:MULTISPECIES: hypothetical protein [unclassified Paenibacillus]MBU5443653.1 hypothetical protein [Paenibacillus sp. MSJ-34]CAH0117684.1 hypothetical protein PAE9249_00144 [Paenibacillus sp. CECT 9249]